MAAKGSPKGKGKATARAKMVTVIKTGRFSLYLDHIQGLVLEHISGLVSMYNVCGNNDERVWVLFYEINFLDPVMTRHVSLF
jgi:hypothetical protein